MNRFRQRKSWIVLIAVLLLFAACKGETPTAPPPGGGVPPGGSPPPTGVTVVLTTTNNNPLVDSSVTITATVTDNGNPVPNGTAVEFTSTGGSLNSSGRTVVRTTTNGVATVTLTSSSVGTVRVTATVNNVARDIDVAFQAKPIDPQPPNTAPTITSVVPSIGRPAGGQIIRINGSNFRSPVRVLFDVGLPSPVEASVVSVTDTTIDVVTPPVNLGAGQQLASKIIIITQAGSTTEQRVELADAFTFRNEQLTPVIFTITPNSGPVLGGTRVTIMGEAFQEPVQVLFGTAEARVLNVTYSQILVESPAARDTSPTGTGPVTGEVAVTVRNINSNTSTASPNGFLYKAAMQITAISPGAGLYSGGTRITIDGNGFVAPVTAVVATGEGDVPLQVISVSGTKILALTPAIAVTSCTDVLGVLTVTNIVNGDQATGPGFRFVVPEPLIVNVNPAVAIQGTTATINVTVANAQPGVNRFKLGDKTVFPSGATVNTDGTVTFVLPLPTNFDFPTAACPTGGERLVPIDLDVTYTNLNSTCTDTAAGALTVEPADTTCVQPPAVLSTSPTGTTCATPVAVTAAAGPTTATITVSNSAAAGGQALQVTGVSFSGDTNLVGAPSSSPPNATIPAGGSTVFTITLDPAAVGAYGTNVTFTTNVGTATVCVSGNAT